MTAIDVVQILAFALLLYLLSKRFLGKVAPDEAKRLVREGAKLVDVRTAGEYGSGHVEGAVNIPVQVLGRRLGELGDKDQDVVVYCASGMRSASAKSILTRAGFTKVHDAGGIGRLL